MSAGAYKKRTLSKLSRLGRKRSKRLRGLMKTGRVDGGEEAGRDVCRVGRGLHEGMGGRNTNRKGTTQVLAGGDNLPVLPYWVFLPVHINSFDMNTQIRRFRTCTSFSFFSDATISPLYIYYFRSYPGERYATRSYLEKYFTKTQGQ